MNDDTRKIDYVFFTAREFSKKVFNEIVVNLEDLLLKSCPKDKRICSINMNESENEQSDDGTVKTIEQIQLEYSDRKPETNSVNVQTCVVVGLMESLVEEDTYHIVVDIPSSGTHLEYDFHIEKDEDDDFDKDTAYRFQGGSRSRGIPEDFTAYQGHKFYKKFVNDVIRNMFEHSHVAIHTDPNDPDAFVYR